MYSELFALILIIIVVSNIEQIINLFKMNHYFYMWLMPNTCNSNRCQVSNDIFNIHPQDTVISYPIKKGYRWEGWMTTYFQRYIKPDTNAVDIGANIGSHTIVMSRFAKTVHAFEPQKKIYKILNDNVRDNHCLNVKSYNLGLSNRKGITYLEKLENKPSNLGAVSIVNGSEKKGEMINTITLDDLKLENVSLIKIDVEGHEYEVLQGARNTISRCKPVIIFEDHHLPWVTPKTFIILRSYGYNKIRCISFFNDFLAIHQDME